MTSDPANRGDLGFFASPPCLMHELDAVTLGFAPVPDAQTWIDVMRWRKATRQRLIAARMAMSAAARAAIAAGIVSGLDALVGDVAGRTVGVYWPMRGEPDLRPWMAGLEARGAVCALPVVVHTAAPVVFRTWHPGMALERDIANIPVPPPGASVIPDIVVAPVVGFDALCYRLGYGAGYYDRTLAALAPQPRAIGVAAAIAALPTIYPQPHDVAMDAIITETQTIPKTPV